MKILKTDDWGTISKLKTGEIAFPDITYHDHLQELSRDSTTVLGAYSTITNEVGDQYFQELDWNNAGDIAWQNDILNEIQIQCVKMINGYKLNDEYEIMKIFLWIQLWGGNAGRNIFVQGRRFKQNFNPVNYKQAVELIIEGDRSQDETKYHNALTKLNNGLKKFGTAFATKHINFWSNGTMPIYDSLIAQSILGYNSAEERHYILYVNSLDKLISEITSEVARSTVERDLFNWASSWKGRRWIEWRVPPPKKIKILNEAKKENWDVEIILKKLKVDLNSYTKFIYEEIFLRGIETPRGAIKIYASCLDKHLLESLLSSKDISHSQLQNFNGKGFRFVEEFRNYSVKTLRN